MAGANLQMKRAIVNSGWGRQYEVSDIEGPFKLACNDGKDYYEGWTCIKPLDPYSEPYKVVFASDSIAEVLE